MQNHTGLCYWRQRIHFSVDNFRSNNFCVLKLPAAKEKAQMPRAALAATIWPQEQRQKDGPFQQAPPLGTQDIFTRAQRTDSRTHGKR